MDHINTWKENQKSPYFGKKRQIIHHPGEVLLPHLMPNYDCQCLMRSFLWAKSDARPRQFIFACIAMRLV